MRHTIIIAALWLLTGCGGGGDSQDEINQIATPRKNIALPSLAHVQSDYSGHPDYGTATDPLIFTGCSINPPVGWQAELCANPPNGIIWPQANYYSTAIPGTPSWTLSANNEYAFDTACNTGPANRSREINKELFFVTPAADKITLRSEFAFGGNCGKIPYLGISTIESGALTGRYGDRIQVKFSIDADFSADPTHFHYFHFFILLADPAGKRKMSWLYLGSHDLTPADRVNWNWPVQNSYYYPGAEITFWPILKYNVAAARNLPRITAKGHYDYTIDFDEVIKTLNPEMATASTRILGMEFAIEQSFDYNAPQPSQAPIFEEITLSNISASKD